MNIISISLLGVKTEEKFNTLKKIKPNFFHLDVMDNIFVANYKDDYESILNDNEIPLDVHLMVKDPIKYIDKYSVYKPDYITIHVEIDNVLEIIDYIKKKNCRVGLAISPDTDILKLYSLLPFIDLVLIMSVVPGYGGQKFIESSLDRIRKIKEYINNNDYKVIISVDGGINNFNYKNVISNGADMLVIGSFITNSDNEEYNLKLLRE